MARVPTSLSKVLTQCLGNSSEFSGTMSERRARPKPGWKPLIGSPWACLDWRILRGFQALGCLIPRPHGCNRVPSHASPISSLSSQWHALPSPWPHQKGLTLPCYIIICILFGISWLNHLPENSFSPYHSTMESASCDFSVEGRR